MTNVHRCPVRACESLILPSRAVCFGHMMALLAADRFELSRLAKEQPHSAELQTAQADAVAWLERVTAGRRP